MTLKGFIPKFISNRVVLGFYGFLRKFQSFLRISWKYCARHFKENEKAYGLKGYPVYIENQNEYTDMRYGRVTMKYAGCEIMAVYNTMYDLTGRHDESLPEMIYEFERDGMAVSGRFGTAPQAIRDYFERHGFETRMTLRESEFDEIAVKSNAVILTFYNDCRDIFKHIHTISVTKEYGKYIAHNTYCDGRVVGPWESISELINNINEGNAKGICLIGIR